MALFQQSGSTADERRSEADRILAMLDGIIEQLEPHEEQFVGDCHGGRPITPRMLFWLRDIKDRYL